MPESGHHGGAANRRKLLRHTNHTIALLEHALLHARRARERIVAERKRHG